MLKIETVHHVSLPASDLERSANFYEGVLGLEPMDRPAFDFDGRWYKVGDRSLHLIVPEDGEDPTFRHGKPIDSRDAHVAIRVGSYRGCRCPSRVEGFPPKHRSQPECRRATIRYRCA